MPWGRIVDGKKNKKIFSIAVDFGYGVKPCNKHYIQHSPMQNAALSFCGFCDFRQTKDFDVDSRRGSDLVSFC